MPVLPAMIRRMSGFHRDERAVAGSAELAVRNQLTFDDYSITGRFNDARNHVDWSVSWRWAQEFDCVVGGHCARWSFEAAGFHEVPGRGPIAVTVEQSSDDASA